MKEEKIKILLLSLILITLASLVTFNFVKKQEFHRFDIVLIDKNNFYLLDNLSNKIYRVCPNADTTTEIDIKIDN